MPYDVPPRWFLFANGKCRYALFSYRAVQLRLKGIDQPSISGPAVFLGKAFCILRHEVAADAVQLPAHGGKLYKNVGTVRTVLDHAANELDMTDGAGQPI